MKGANQIKAVSFLTLIKFTAIGVLCSEALYFSKIAAAKISQFIDQGNHESAALIILTWLPIFLIIYLIYRDFFLKLWRIAASNRIDLLIVFLIGIFLSISFNGVGSNFYNNIISNSPPERIIFLICFPIIIASALLIREIQLRCFVKIKSDPIFVSDTEQKNKYNDLLGFSDRAERFAEIVFNQGSPDSHVFGIDAPWGTGKSSFLNFCKEYWESQYLNEIIVYTFNPLRYEDRGSLLGKFLDGLIRVIQKNAFVPEIRPLVSKYSRLIKETKGYFPFFDFNLDAIVGDYSLTIDDVFDDLEVVLAGIDKKIIIIVDDLDRLNFSEIQDVLFVVKNSFTLPNISYVLCYDADNIKVLESENPNTEKITEFFEKFINIKIGLYLDAQALSRYVSENLKIVLRGNSKADPVLVGRVMGGLADIFKSKDYHSYLPFIGDIRKLKRLINIVILLEVEKTDFENSDFDSQDLIHLLLVYINYPAIFKKIYDTETDEKYGFFSAVTPHDDRYPKDPKNSARENTYKNSADYLKYIGNLSSDNQKFLLNRIFSIPDRLSDSQIDQVSQEIKTSYACFNGGGFFGGGRNLEQYLNLISKFSKPQREGQHKFYLNCKNQIMNGKSADSVLSQGEFAISNGESNHEQFWRIINNSHSDFNGMIAAQLISSIVSAIPRHSLFSHQKLGLGFRKDLSLFLIIALDGMGWTDGGDRHDNSQENILEIAEWIFGEGRHKDSGILRALAAEDRGILGLYDLLRFRLFCNSDRGGDIFNLQRALSKHADPSAPTEGSVKLIVIEEMREISQAVFEFFEDQYINKDVNIFDSIEALTLDDLCGLYGQFVNSRLDLAQEVVVEVAKLKSLIKTFSIYQLGNTVIEHGVGCGYYDEVGKNDKQGINQRMNDYLFKHCFNPSLSVCNYEHFLDYLLINLTNSYEYSRAQKYIPSINELTKVLDKARLADYWRSNSAAIKALNLPSKDKKIITVNYTASYQIDLKPLYELLDNFILPASTPSISVEDL